MCKKEALLGKTFTELKQICDELEMPSFTAKQLCEWIYKRQVKDIAGMTNLSLFNRNKLENKYVVGHIAPIQMQQSNDGTIKYLFPTNDNRYIESVLIPDDDRVTLCVSSQIGCKMNCYFCMTGKQGFSGDLSSNEIINQIWSVPEKDKLTNIVMMGMGEPLDNTDNLLKALEILTSDYGYGWSPKRITVSTVGLIPGLKRFLDESDCHLAISIHSPYPEERLSLMPVEKAYPLSEVLNLVRRYDFSHQRRLSFEYITFRGINDDLQHAKDMAGLLNEIPCRVNLIRYHAIPGVELQPTSEDKLIRFRDYLSSKGIICTIRASRGQDILAACGMLSTKENKKNSK